MSCILRALPGVMETHNADRWWASGGHRGASNRDSMANGSWTLTHRIPLERVDNPRLTRWVELDVRGYSTPRLGITLR